MIGDNVYVMYGAANNMRFDDVHVFNVKNKDWKEILATGTFPMAREGAALVTVIPPRPDFAPDYRSSHHSMVSIKEQTPGALDSNSLKPPTRPAVRFRKYNANEFFVVLGGASTGIVH